MSNTIDMSGVTEPGRTLVLCFDGTGDQFDADNTNIPQLYDLLKKDGTSKQLCYYQPGIGTWLPDSISPVFQWGAKMLDEAFAWDLDKHIQDGYKFIMDNWKLGDKICLFGFSRGAYTARALAGLLHKVGLLPRGSDGEVATAYKLYTRRDSEGLQSAANFKRMYCRDVKIEFIGVWDTVASVGVVTARTLPFVSSNNAIKTFRHALSLDERRAKYQPSPYHTSITSDSSVAGLEDARSNFGPGSNKPEYPPRSRKARVSSLEEKEDNNCDVLEVWFAGCHSDVGGGAVPNGTPLVLANITLRWMIREVVKSGCGILFDSDALKKARISLMPGAGEISRQDDNDAVQPIHDSLETAKAWWALEYFPTSYTRKDASGKWITKLQLNMGRGRVIDDPRPVFHSSVKTRMNSHLKYKPLASWTRGSEVYVS